MIFFRNNSKSKGKVNDSSTNLTDVESIESNGKSTNDYKMKDMLWRNYDLNIIRANEITIEVYRESKIKEGWEVPSTFIGIRIFEDGTLKENVIVHSFADYGLFSYTAAFRHSTSAKLALDIADSIANIILFGQEFYDYKIKKRFVSKSHIYLLKIPAEYEIDMPKPDQYCEKILELEIKIYDLYKKKAMNPKIDITEEKEKIDVEFKKHIENHC
ncbi:hypothetical protein [Neobacillus sp. YIM B06451]|uniref:hypothetical protein n=1 Tax=Neobacillus sp. YIM B06451 TaxID=3070994 RepID=UPI0029309C0C|nr:hypothetical protein [Neobacillus sp. YIM B06451]